jgi:hypothetical protein
MTISEINGTPKDLSQEMGHHQVLLGVCQIGAHMIV